MQVAMKSGQDADQETAAWEASVSAWMDAQGEIRPEDLDSPYGRQVWDTYHLIGDVLRSEDLAIKSSSLFYARVSRMIDAEPPIVAPHRRKLSSMRLGLSGLAVAAAVASVAWVALPYFSGADADAGHSQTRVLASANDDSGLHDYLEAHRQIAGVSAVRPVSYDGEGSR